tara:strand:+ start:201 stop:1196 length:996 start_codon:yes stop_codon:yes gene_type:complete
MLVPFCEPATQSNSLSLKGSSFGIDLRIPDVLTEEVYVEFIRRWASMAHDPLLVLEEVRKVDKVLRRQKPTGDLVVVDISCLDPEKNFRQDFAQLFRTNKKSKEYAMSRYAFARLELLNESGEEATISLDPFTDEVHVVRTTDLYHVQESSLGTFLDCYWNPVKGLYGLVSELMEEGTLEALKIGGADMEVVRNAVAVQGSSWKWGERKNWGNKEMRRLVRLDKLQLVLHSVEKVKRMTEKAEEVLILCVEKCYSLAIQWSILTPTGTIPLIALNNGIAQMYNFVEKIPVRADMELKFIYSSLQSHKQVRDHRVVSRLINLNVYSSPPSPP